MLTSKTALADLGVLAAIPTAGTSTTAIIGGGIAIAHGIDDVITGYQQMLSGQPESTAAVKMMRSFGVSANTADIVDFGLGLATPFADTTQSATRAVGNAFQRFEVFGRGRATNIMAISPSEIAWGMVSFRRGKKRYWIHYLNRDEL